MDSNLVRRVGFAVVAIPAALGIVWLGGWPLVALIALIGVLGTREVFDFSHRQGIRGSAGIALTTAAAVAPLAYLVITGTDTGRVISAWWPYAASLWVVTTLTWALAARHPGDRPLESVAITLFAPLYAAALPAFLLVLRHGAYRRVKGSTHQKAPAQAPQAAPQAAPAGSADDTDPASE